MKIGKDWNDLSSSQGMPNIASNYWKPGKRHGTDPPSQLTP